MSDNAVHVPGVVVVGVVLDRDQAVAVHLVSRGRRQDRVLVVVLDLKQVVVAREVGVDRLLAVGGLDGQRPVPGVAGVGRVE